MSEKELKQNIENYIKQGAYIVSLKYQIEQLKHKLENVENNQCIKECCKVELMQLKDKISKLVK